MNNVISAGVNCCCCDLWHDDFSSQELFEKRWQSLDVRTREVVAGGWTVSSGKAICSSDGIALHVNFLHFAAAPFSNEPPAETSSEWKGKLPRVWKFTCTYNCPSGGCLTFDPYTLPTGTGIYSDPLTALVSSPANALLFADGNVYFGFKQVRLADGTFSDERFAIISDVSPPYEIEAWSGQETRNGAAVIRVKVNNKWCRLEMGFNTPLSVMHPVFFSTTSGSQQVSNARWYGYDYDDYSSYDYKARPECKCAGEPLNNCWGNYWPWKKTSSLTVQFDGFEITPTPIAITVMSENTASPRDTGIPGATVASLGVTVECQRYTVGYETWSNVWEDAPFSGQAASQDYTGMTLFALPAALITDHILIPDIAYGGDRSYPQLDPVEFDLYPTGTIQCTHYYYYYTFGPHIDHSIQTDRHYFTDYKPLFPQTGTYILPRIEDAVPANYNHSTEIWSVEIDLGYGITRMEVQSSATGIFLILFKDTVQFMRLPLGGEIIKSSERTRLASIFNPGLTNFARTSFPQVEGPWNAEVHLGYAKIGQNPDFTPILGYNYYKLANQIVITPNYE